MQPLMRPGARRQAFCHPFADRLAVRLSVVFIGARIGRRSVQMRLAYSHGLARRSTGQQSRHEDGMVTT